MKTHPNLASLGSLALAAGLSLLLMIPKSEAGVRIKSARPAVAEGMRSGRKLPLKVGEVQEIQLDEPWMIRSPDHLPTLLVPVHSSDSELQLNPPPVREWVAESRQTNADQLLSEVLMEVAQIQSLVQRARLLEADQKLSALQARYPGLAFLKFIRASLLMMTGNRDEARKVTEEALAAHPDYEEGRQFLKSIGGRIPAVAGTDGKEKERD